MKHSIVIFGLACAISLHCSMAVTNFAGTGIAGCSGDGAAASQARLNNPFGLVRGPDGALCFADYAANVIRRIGTNRLITTVVGNGKAAHSGDARPPLAAPLNHPHDTRL